MKIEEMQEKLRGLGLRKTFRPVWEPESSTILLATRRPATITDGKLQGCEIALMHGGAFRIWTAQTRKAATLSKAHGLRLRQLTGEAEVLVPAGQADMVLPQFGAKVKRSARSLTEAQRAALMAHSFRTPRDKTEVRAIEAHQEALESMSAKPEGLSSMLSGGIK